MIWFGLQMSKLNKVTTAWMKNSHLITKIQLTEIQRWRPHAFYYICTNLHLIFWLSFQVIKPRLNRLRSAASEKLEDSIVCSTISLNHKGLSHKIAYLSVCYWLNDDDNVWKLYICDITLLFDTRRVRDMFSALLWPAHRWKWPLSNERLPTSKMWVMIMKDLDLSIYYSLLYTATDENKHCFNMVCCYKLLFRKWVNAVLCVLIQSVPCCIPISR